MVENLSLCPATALAVSVPKGEERPSRRVCGLQTTRDDLTKQKEEALDGTDSLCAKRPGPPEVKELYENCAGQFKLRDVPNVVKALANSPKLARRVFPLGDYFMRESTLDPRLRELAVLTLMNRLHCNYGFVRHIPIAEHTGISRAQIDTIAPYATSGLFSSDDKEIIKYAEDLTLKGQVDDELYRRVQDRIGQQHLLDLTAAIAFWNMMARNLNALKIDLEDW